MVRCYMTGRTLISPDQKLLVLERPCDRVSQQDAEVWKGDRPDRHLGSLLDHLSEQSRQCIPVGRERMRRRQTG